MLFNSVEFFVFLPLVFILYWFVFKKSLKGQNVLLLLSSYIFYAWWDWRFLFLLIASSGFGYIAGIKINDSKTEFNKRLWVWFYVGVVVGFLCFVKYYNFFIESWVEALALFNYKADPWTLNIILPLGISFYTFHGLSDLLDIYNQKINATRNAVDYGVFVSYFPLLVAGPIERATHLLPQIEKERNFDYQQSNEGVRLIVWGLFKKIVIADSLALAVNDIFGHHQDFTATTLILGAVFFSIQIYSDFSGYTDIARGVSKLFGIELILNFNFPYFSKSIPEFWHRWHISLSSWLNDYFFTPVAVKYRDHGKWGIYMAIFLTFLISGLWHGAGWNFIFWGALHGLFYFPYVILSKKKFRSISSGNDSNEIQLSKIVPILFTFSLISFANIFFRSASLSEAVSYIKKMSSDLVYYPGQVLLIPKYSEYFIYVLALLVIDLIWHSSVLAVKFKERYYLKNAIDIAFIFVIISYLFRVDSNSFIYFQF